MESRKDIATLYKEIVEQAGQEGIVVRSQNGPVYKVKPLITLDAVILGYAEGEGSRAGMLKEVLVGLCVAKDQYTLLTQSGQWLYRRRTQEPAQRTWKEKGRFRLY